MFILILASIAAACVPAAQATVTSTQPGEITVIGRGEAIGEPDQAQVHVGVDILGETVTEAADQNEAVIQDILAALEGQGVAANDVQTTNFNVWVEQRYLEEGPPQIAGYHVSSEVRVLVRAVDSVSEILAAVMEAGANNIFGISFSIADPSSLEEEARREAMADARTRAEALAQLGEVELGGIKVISEVFTEQVATVIVEQEVAAAAGPSISPGQLSFQIQIQVTYFLQ